jgi:hypothetical protein
MKLFSFSSLVTVWKVLMLVVIGFYIKGSYPSYKEKWDVEHCNSESSENPIVFKSKIIEYWKNHGVFDAASLDKSVFKMISPTSVVAYCKDLKPGDYVLKTVGAKKSENTDTSLREGPYNVDSHMFKDRYLTSSEDTQSMSVSFSVNQKTKVYQGVIKNALILPEYSFWVSLFFDEALPCLFLFLLFSPMGFLRLFISVGGIFSSGLAGASAGMAADRLVKRERDSQIKLAVDKAYAIRKARKWWL